MKDALSVLAVVLSLTAVGAVLVLKPEAAPQLGAQSESLVEGGCYVLNGTQVCPVKKALSVATTTVCAIKSPTSTSTLASAGVQLIVSSSSASTVHIAKATTAFATTTLLDAAYAVGANAQATILASTTDAAGKRVFAPNTFLVVGMQGGTGTFSPTGSCFAEFIVN